MKVVCPLGDLWLLSYCIRRCRCCLPDSVVQKGVFVRPVMDDCIYSRPKRGFRSSCLLWTTGIICISAGTTQRVPETLAKPVASVAFDAGHLAAPHDRAAARAVAALCRPRWHRQVQQPPSCRSDQVPEARLCGEVHGNVETCGCPDLGCTDVRPKRCARFTGMRLVEKCNRASFASVCITSCGRCEFNGLMHRSRCMNSFAQTHASALYRS